MKAPARPGAAAVVAVGPGREAGLPRPALSAAARQVRRAVPAAEVQPWSWGSGRWGRCGSSSRGTTRASVRWPRWM
ncbi:hypothetical protein SUDANB37_05006 [Streptomyces sp. enrichment culture]